MDKGQMMEIPIQHLHLDKKNPRLPRSKRTGSEDDIINYLLLEAATIELMEAIGENGYFPGEILLVVQDGEQNYTVVEGNRRLCSVKLLKDPSLARYKKESVYSIAKNVKQPAPDQLPCLVFQSRESIINYLGFVHITGKQSWGLLQKGRYLYEYYLGIKTNDFSADCKKIAKQIGSTSPYVARLLQAFNIYREIENEGFYSIEGLSDMTFHLNYLVDGLNKENIRRHLKVDLEQDDMDDVDKRNLKELTIWWFEKSEGQSRVKGDSESLKMLNAVLGNEKALDSFRNKGATIEKAYAMTSDYGTQIERSVKLALDEMENVDKLIVNIDNFDSLIVDDLKSIKKLSNKLIAYIMTSNDYDDNE